MPDFPYVRNFARTDSVVVNNGNGSWDISKPFDPLSDPTMLWLRLPDTEEGVQRLVAYDWDLDVWTDITPEE